MSSLRLALKQSLAESTENNEGSEKDRRRREAGDKKKRKDGRRKQHALKIQARRRRDNQNVEDEDELHAESNLRRKQQRKQQQKVRDMAAAARRAQQLHLRGGGQSSYSTGGSSDNDGDGSSAAVGFESDTVCSKLSVSGSSSSCSTRHRSMHGDGDDAFVTATHVQSQKEGQLIFHRDFTDDDDDEIDSHLGSSRVGKDGCELHQIIENGDTATREQHLLATPLESHCKPYEDKPHQLYKRRDELHKFDRMADTEQIPLKRKKYKKKLLKWHNELHYSKVSHDTAAASADANGLQKGTATDQSKVEKVGDSNVDTSAGGKCVALDNDVGTATTISSPRKKKKKKNIPTFVPPPNQRVLLWVRAMSELKQRRHIREGHRVKVQFDMGSNSDDKMDKDIEWEEERRSKKRRIRWYGGLVLKVSSNGRRVKVLYDDGTSEVTGFPDDDIIVDADMNGQHSEDVGGSDWQVNLFIPPPPEPPRDKSPVGDAEIDRDVGCTSGEAKLGEKAAQTELVPPKLNDKSVHEVALSRDSERALCSSSPKTKCSGQDWDEMRAKRKENEVFVRKEENASTCVTGSIDSANRSVAVSASLTKGRDRDDRAPLNDDAAADTKSLIDRSMSSSANTAMDVEIDSIPHQRKQCNNMLIDNATYNEKKAEPRSSKQSSRSSSPMPNNAAGEGLAREREAKLLLDSAAVGRSGILNCTDAGEHAVAKVEGSSSLARETPQTPAGPKKSQSENQETSSKRSASPPSSAQSNFNSAGGFDSNRDQTNKRDNDDQSKSEGSEEEDEEISEDSQEENWVQCDRCMKWRLLPQSLSMVDLPDRWFCELNIYDPKRQNCEAPEQPADETNSSVGKKKKDEAATSTIRESSKARTSPDGVHKRKKKRSRRKSSGSGKESSSISNRDFSEAGLSVEVERKSSLYGLAMSGDDPHDVCFVSEAEDNCISSSPGEASNFVLDALELTNDYNKTESLDSIGKVTPYAKQDEAADDVVKEHVSGSYNVANGTVVPVPDLETGFSAMDYATSFEDVDENADDQLSHAQAFGVGISDVDTSVEVNLQKVLHDRENKTEAFHLPSHGDANISTTMSDARKIVKSAKSRNGRKRDRDVSISGDQVKPLSRGNKASRLDKKQSLEKDQQEWVQCEKCEKWRRLPPRIRAKDLPDIWYCSMNTWDIRNATCSAAEDKAEIWAKEKTILGAEGASGGGTGKSGGGRLSYRNLIFGNGRRQVRPASERARAAESLFVDPATINGLEADGERCVPTVMYANSSAFVPRGGKGGHGDDLEKHQKVSLFDVMSKSHLWRDLRNGRNSVKSNAHWDAGRSSHLNVQGDSDIGNDTWLAGSAHPLSENMKALISHVLCLEKRPFAAHEVLLEAQCRDWSRDKNSFCEEWADLRASCTIESINVTLQGLVRDKVAEVVADILPKEISLLGNTVRYKSCQHEDDRMPQTQIFGNPNTRCIKLVKPWKSADSAGKRCRWSGTGECEELLRHAQSRYHYLKARMAPDPLHMP